MRLVDASVLLYAVDEDAERHRESKAWLDRALGGTETILLPWASLLAFVRISTHPSVYERPLTIDQTTGVVEAWLRAPMVVVPEPDARHAQRLCELLDGVGRGGNLVTDAHLAALAVQYNATVMTFDNDFDRFAGVRWERPTV